MGSGSEPFDPQENRDQNVLEQETE
jgi:hypothetical protein